jgi:hypothetical protein
MTESDRIDQVVHELRYMASTGADVPTLLRRIQDSFGMNDCKIISVKCFHKAFGGGIAAISAVGGWTGFGGELSDAEVQSLVSPVVICFRDHLEADSVEGNVAGAHLAPRT